MRKILYLVAALLLTASSFAQTPASFNYQAVIRDASGNIQANQNVAIDLKILQGKFSDSVVYTEFWNIQTNALGLINLEIGSKDSLAFGKINWQNGPFFIAVTVDGEYLGSSQLLSVPFSMQADKATFANTAQVAIDDKVDDADADPTNEIQDISLVGDQLSISGGSTVTLPGGGSETPQTLSIAGQQLSISNGNTITIPDRFRDDDDDPTNELELPLQQAGDANKSLVADGAGNVSWQTTAGGGVTETQVDAFVANNGYQLSADDADTDPANEIQDLNLAGDILKVTGNPAATEINLAAYKDNTDDQTLTEILTNSNSAGNNTISDLIDPVHEQDAATKKYVDNMSAGKVNIEAGKQLSSNDFTDAEKTKLAGAELVANKNMANGYPGLNANKKIDISQLPALTINNVYTVSNETDQLVLTANQGDVAIRVDIAKNYIHNGGTAGTLADWTELASPNVEVTSVNGKTGDVVLGITDIATLQSTLNELATKTALKDSTAQVRSEIPDVSVFVSTETDPVYSAWDKSTGISITESQVSDLGNYIETETDPVYTSSEAANITAGDITNLGNLSGTNTGDQDLSALATKTALKDSTAQVRSEIPDVSRFLSSETDPVYSAWDKSTGISITESQVSDLGNYIETEADPVYTSSEAANITSTDIANLGNLSGTNTGDQDLSTLATKTALKDSTAQVRSEIPDVSGFVSTETDPVYSAWDKSTGISITESQVSDLGNYIETEVDPVYSGSQAANITAGDITKLSNLSGINTGDQDLSTLATKTALKDSTAQVRSEIPDVSGFVSTETDPVYSAWDKSTGISITESQVSDLGNYIETETDPVFTSSEAANITSTDIANLGNLSGTNTGDQDLSALATKNALKDSTAQVRSEIPDVSGFVSTETDPVYSAWDKSTGISITESQVSDLGNYIETEVDPVYSGSEAVNITAGDITKLSNLSGTNTGDQDLSALATKTALGDSTAQVRSEIPDVSGFLSSETDPVYTSSEAVHITAGDITNLGNLSGTNTGDQDISGIAANTQAIKDTASQIRSDIPDVSGFLVSETDPVYSAWDKSTGISITESQVSDLGNYIETETDPVYTSSEAANITAGDITNLGNLSGTNTGDQDISGIAANTQAIKDTASQIRSDIPDVSGFLVSETDPVYSAWDKSTGISITESQVSDLGNYIETETDPVYTSSEAANITAGDITNLGNLSGTNTGDQDLSTLATKTALKDSTAQVRSEIPDVSGFITSETDPVYSAWDKSTGISITESQISDLQSYLTTEVDGSVTNEIELPTQVAGDANKVLTADGTGTVSWETSATSQWTTSSNDIYYNTGNVGIGTSPSNKLDVAGSININEGSAYLYDGEQAVRLAKGTDTYYANTFVGQNAGNTLATRQTAFGYYAGASNTGNYQVALGTFAGRDNTGTTQIALGHFAGRSNEGAQVIGIGFEATNGNTADDVVAIGFRAGKGNTDVSQFIVKQANKNAVPLMQGNFTTGNLGIGTTSPGAKLEVNSSDNSAATLIIKGGPSEVNAVGYINAQLDFGSRDASVKSPNNIGSRIASIVEATDGSLVGLGFYTHDYRNSPYLVEHMRIDYKGRVGIGTEEPDHILDVRGNIGLEVSGYLNWGSDDGSTGYGLRDNSGTIQFKNSGGSWADLESGGISTETDPVFGSSTASGITETDITNWNSKISSETDPEFGGWDKSTGISITESQISDLQSYLTTEVDGSVTNEIELPTQVAGDADKVLTADGTGTVSWETPAANQWTTSSNDIYYSTGKVGIGTTSPNVALHVEGTGGTQLSVKASDASGSARVKVFGKDQTAGFHMGQHANGGSFIWNAENGKIDFGTNNSTRLTIDKDGNVGIGIASPTQKLDVSGAIQATDFRQSGNMLLTFDEDNTGSGDLIFRGGTSEKMRILQNGNVGIGTTNPTAKLFIGQSNDALVDKTSFLINNSDQSQTKPIFKIESYDNEANFNVLELTNENLITDFVVQSQGNVGIGTATPEARLHVHGSSVTNSKTLLIDGFGASQGYGIFMQPNNNDIGMHYVTFANNTGSVIGSISRGVLSGISYNTNSDYRLKENVAELDAEMAVKKVMAARPVSYTWKSDGSADVGFIAHELMEAGFVNAVAGEKDAVDADGKIVPQGVDYGRITPEIMKVVQYLVKENEKLRAEIEASGLLIIDLKEQQKQIEALKNEVELLKNK